jgi:uncharacterized protein (TIGR03435 family)
MRPALHLTALSLCIVLADAQSPPAPPEFEVASVKPNTSGNNLINIRPPVGGRFSATNARLRMLISIAYKVKDFEISGGPGWINTDGYDITAKAANGNLDMDQIRPMLQSLLADRFKLAVHRENKEMPLYVLMPTKNGPKLPEAKENGCQVFNPSSPPPPPPSPGELPPVMCGGFLRTPFALHAGKVGMAQLVNVLSDILGRPVIDKTGFTGTFDVKLEFSPEGTAFGAGVPGPVAGPQTDADTSRPSIFTALQEQLGLKLESQKGPAEILLIDHAEKPSEN